jgi:cytochrome c556
MTELFPEGSGGGASDATPEVWSEWEKFEALAAQLGTYANGLALAADNGLSDAMGSQTGAGMMGSGSTNSMMGTTGMMGGSVEPMMDFAEMPADMAFNMVAQTCASCHATFREKE